MCIDHGDESLALQCGRVLMSPLRIVCNVVDVVEIPPVHRVKWIADVVKVRIIRVLALTSLLRASEQLVITLEQFLSVLKTLFMLAGEK